MEIKARVTRFEKDNLKGLASITLYNEFVVNNIKIMDGSKGLFVSMPSYKNKDGEFAQIAFPKTHEAYEAIQETVLKEYQKVLELGQEHPEMNEEKAEEQVKEPAKKNTRNKKAQSR